MTVASAVARSGPYAGNGSQTVFAYTFKVFASSELQVVLRSATGIETVQTLTTHYTVSGVGNDAGGNVTMVAAPPNGATLTIVRDVPFVQLTDLRNQGGFYPEVHERVFDRLVMQTQQLAEEVGRSVKLTVGSPIDPDVFNQSINTLAENVDDVNAVATNMADVQAVAAIDADVQVAAANVADITNFADVYQGPKATDPTLRNDSTALQNGDLYFNTATARMRAYGGGIWVDAGTPIPLTIATQQFSGTGAQTVFTLSAAPAFPAALDVFISGVSQKLTTDYTVSGTTLTFVAAPPAGANNIYVKILSAYAGGVPNDGSVTTAKLAFDGGALSGARNRIINGDMRIDQRNGGAGVTLTNSVGYVLDRYRAVALGTSLGFSSQRSTVAPSGFINSYLATVTSAKTPASADQCRIDQFIEGVNAADLGWGAVSAQTVQLSFWVRSSVAGIYCVHLGNDAAPTRSFITQYTINLANTWEYKTITIPGDTTGTWGTGTSYGVNISFVLGMGSNFTGSAGWQAGERFQTSSQTNWIANAGATFYITGVQLEQGSVATPFERRQHGAELALCQRYYETALVTGFNYAGAAGPGWNMLTYGFRASKRATPTMSFTGAAYAGCSDLVLTPTTENFLASATSSGITAMAFNATFQASAEL